MHSEVLLLRSWIVAVRHRVVYNTWWTMKEAVFLDRSFNLVTGKLLRKNCSKPR